MLLIPLGAYDLLPPLPGLVWRSEYAGYRRSPQFRNYLHRSGVVDYWRDHGFPPQCRPVGEGDFSCD
jgi:hypothetical protein